MALRLASQTNIAIDLSPAPERESSAIQHLWPVIADITNHPITEDYKKSWHGVREFPKEL